MSLDSRTIKVIALTALAILSQSVWAIGPLPAVNFEERKSDQASRDVLEKCVFGPVCDLPVVNIVESVQLLAHSNPQTGNRNLSDLSNFEYIIDSKKLAAVDELDIQISVTEVDQAQALQDCDVVFEQFRYLHPEINYITGHYCEGGTSGEGYIAPGASRIYDSPGGGGITVRQISYRDVIFSNPRYTKAADHLVLAGGHFEMVEYDVSMKEKYFVGTYYHMDLMQTEITNFPPIKSLVRSASAIYLGCSINGTPDGTMRPRSGILRRPLTLQGPVTGAITRVTASISLAKQFDGAAFKLHPQLERIRSACPEIGNNLILFGYVDPYTSIQTTSPVNIHFRYGSITDETNLWDNYATTIRDDLNYSFDTWNNLNTIHSSFTTSNAELLKFLVQYSNKIKDLLGVYSLDPATPLIDVEQFFYGPGTGDLAGVFIPIVSIPDAPADWLAFDRDAKDKATGKTPVDASLKSSYVQYLADIQMLDNLNAVRISKSTAILVNLVNTAVQTLDNEMLRSQYFLALADHAKANIKTSLAALTGEITGALALATSSPTVSLQVDPQPTVSPISTAPTTFGFLPITSSNGPNAPITASSFIDIIWTGAAPPAGYYIAIFEEATGLLRIQKSVSAMTFDATTQEWYIALSVTNTTRVGNYLVGFTSANIDTLFGAPRSDVFSVVR
ncbi:MAG: hypothetical protein ACC707_00280 [Thiohalomonadales bacterium]